MRFIVASALLLATGAPASADWIKIRFDGAVTDIYLNTEDGKLYLDDRETPLLEFRRTRTKPAPGIKRKSADADAEPDIDQSYEFSDPRTLDRSAPAQVSNRNRLLTIKVENGVAYQIIRSPAGPSVHTGSAKIIERSAKRPLKPPPGAPVSGTR
jgi:hypothetical protein